MLCMDRELAADEPHVYGDISEQHLPQTHCVQPLESVYEYIGQRSVAQLFAAAHSGFMFGIFSTFIIYIVLKNIKLISDEGLNNLCREINLV